MLDEAPSVSFEPYHPDCPACGRVAAGNPIVEIPKDGRRHATMLDCPDCRTEFSPRRSPADPRWYGEKETYLWRWEFDRFLDDLAGRAGPRASVLEIGCGEGLLLSKLSGRYDSWGLDFNEAATRVAAERGLRVFPWTLERFREAYPHTRFHAVAFFHVLEHLERPLRFLEQVASILLPGGHVFLSTPNPKRCSLVVEREEWDHPPHHLQRFSREGLPRLLDRAGFRVEQCLDQPAEDEVVRLARIHAYRRLPLPKRVREVFKLPILALLGPYAAHLRRTRTGLSWYLVARTARRD